MTALTDAYLSRIGVTAPAAPDVDALRRIVAAHTAVIPFENLDPLCGIPVADLSADALSDKLIARRRGGYCYEHNGLLGYVLDDLGYEVQRLAGRVVWMHDGADLPAQTHQALAVTLPDGDGPWLVDVGFGGQTPSSPMRLRTGPVQQTRHEPYRLLDHAEGVELQAEIRGEWRSLYLLGLRPRPRIDLEVGSWYVSTFPHSGFVTGLRAALVTDDARWNLSGRRLTVHRTDGSDTTLLDGPAAVVEVLESRFGIAVADLGDRAELQRRIAEVIDI